MRKPLFFYFISHLLRNKGHPICEECVKVLVVEGFLCWVSDVIGVGLFRTVSLSSGGGGGRKRRKY